MKKEEATSHDSTRRRDWLSRTYHATALGIFGAIALITMTQGTVLAATMQGGMHDLSTTGVAVTSGETQVCVFCHVPHNSQPDVARPLWGHEMTVANLTWTPAATVRGTVLPTVITSDELAGSRACMSCHDGTVALGDLLNTATVDDPVVTGTNVTAGKLSGGLNFLDPDTMESNHPLGVPAPAPVTGSTGFKTPSGSSAVGYDALGLVQCGSCHNPHDNTNPPFLKISNAGSAICTTCHDL